MTRRNTSKPGETIGLKLSTEERQLLLDLTFAEKGILHRIRRTPADQADVQLSLDQLGSLAGSVAADANRTSDKTRRAELARIYDKIDYLVNSHPEDESATEPEAVRLAQFAASILVLADSYAEAGIIGSDSISRTQHVELMLTKAERALVLNLPTLKDSLRGKLGDALSRDRTFQLTLNDLAVLCFAVSEALLEGEGPDTVRLRNVAGKAELVLVHCLNQNAAPQKSRPEKKKNTIYQLKITLKDIEPPIWRRIQVKDCSLTVLHKLIQAAMGWENYDQYLFRIGGKEYSDPTPLDDDFDMEDAGAALLSDVVPEDGRRFRFGYTYNLDDRWQHEILFEGCPRAEKGVRYPLCLEGARACPPEDVGGASGYEDYLEGITHAGEEDREDRLVWQGSFDPERFDLESVNRALRRVRR